MADFSYTAHPVLTDGRLTDVRLEVDGKTRHMWGRRGVKQESAWASEVPEGSVAVLLGSGLGLCLDMLVERGVPVAVVDAEGPMIRATKADKERDDSAVMWIRDLDPDQALEKLTRWQMEHGSKPFHVLAPPFYQRLRPELYTALNQRLEAASRADFWAKASRPRFRSASPKVLILSRHYFLYREITSALERMGLEYLELEVGEGDTVREGFVEELLGAAVDFAPDFALTVNHLGLDREGALSGLLEKLNLPLASWFVDSPHLILHRYSSLAGENTAVFTWDKGTIQPLRDFGFHNVHYLPLATDATLFKPGKACAAPEKWRADVSFVGHSMIGQVKERLEKAAPGPGLEKRYVELAAGFGRSGQGKVADYLRENYPGAHADFEALPNDERRLDFEALVTWESTRQYRHACVRQLLPFSPLIAGDAHWENALPKSGWRRLDRLDYYLDLPLFYPLSKINFNCTSTQMKGAVNQRIFDAPACGAFILTDHRDQLPDLFEPGIESVAFNRVEDIPEIVERYLNDDAGREEVARAARKRILAEHTYDHRLAFILETMRQSFGA